MNDEYSQIPAKELNSQTWKPPTDTAEEGVEVPFQSLPLETLEALIQAYVLREGTDYGDSEATLERKVTDIKNLLARGKARIVFDLTTQTCSVMTLDYKTRNPGPFKEA